MLRPVAMIAALLAPGVAHAGWTVEQKVVYGGAATGDATFKWTVGEKGFRVDVKRGADARHYVFNGQTFYVCGRLDRAALDYVKSLKLNDAALLDSLAKGACQELSTDFAVRFYMSPYDAVQSVEVAQGFAANAAIDPANVAIGGNMGTAAGSKCVKLTRTWTQKDSKAPKLALSFDEDSCKVAGVRWRHDLDREVSKACLRRAGGKTTSTNLNGDLKKAPGLSFTAEAEINGTDATGAKVKRTYKVTTASAKEGEPSAADLGMPAGFRILDLDNLPDMEDTKVATPSGAIEEPDAADILGALILGAMPGSALMKAVSDGGEKKK